MEKKVLIVDDEERVVQSIVGVLEDEGFRVTIAADGEGAIELFQKEEPDVTLLDIWMAGMDGIEVLKRLKGISPECLVIMISGHATISTAMAAVKFGAFDFIEKPLSLDLLLLTIRRALDRQREFPGIQTAGEMETPEIPAGEKTTLSKEIPEGFVDSSSVASRKASSISSSLQRTLKRSMVLYGTGLHSGMKTGLLLQPLPPNSGILFGSISYEDVVPAHLNYVQSTEFATALKKGRASAMTIEHLMAVLHAYRITNLMVKMIEEIPIMDGSALEFCKMIEEAGVEEQEGNVEELVIGQRMEILRGNKSLVIEPSDTFSVYYFLDYPFPVGKQSLRFVLKGEKTFKEEIAPARTFGFLKDVEMLERMGLGEGGRLHNFILVDDEKIVNTELRFPDEFVRHKILDLIGDFYLLNRPVRGRVTAHLTGHSENIALMKKIQGGMRKGV
ncbi:MAG: UDP-3-O-[3-hydroxymyristoyl] N-acetylglucosamine deacetylase [Deltaproteobacteria bacterium RBG_16_48_10]|nr:MAG: UDP-3-O-[3-hydroxymyristoyl] N-acetylglucosamine deacetylase [Deltaproteobacteria bacterium RBG_16_48_10]